MMRHDPAMRIYVVLKRELEGGRLADVKVMGIFRTEAGALRCVQETGSDTIQQWEVGGELLQVVPC